jgi:hypothetical protein
MFCFYLVCEAIGTAATPGLLCQPRVILKMIVEKQMECRLARETKVLGENLPQRHFCPSQNPTWPDPGRRDGKPASNRLSYGAAITNLLLTILNAGNVKESSKISKSYFSIINMSIHISVRSKKITMVLMIPMTNMVMIIIIIIIIKTTYNSLDIKGCNNFDYYYNNNNSGYKTRNTCTNISTYEPPLQSEPTRL